jgi:hypothetical protein
MGHDPNRSLRCRPHVKWNDQSFDDWELSLIEVLKIPARIRKKLRRFAVERDSARTEVPGGCSTDILCEFSGMWRRVAEGSPNELEVRLRLLFRHYCAFLYDKSCGPAGQVSCAHVRCQDYEQPNGI